MKYFIIAGEASGDLHASLLISALRNADPKAEFRFLGGDKRINEAIKKWSKKSGKEALERSRKELKESDELLDKLEREKQEKD